MSLVIMWGEKKPRLRIKYLRPGPALLSGPVLIPSLFAPSLLSQGVVKESAWSQRAAQDPALIPYCSLAPCWVLHCSLLIQAVIACSGGELAQASVWGADTRGKGMRGKVQWCRCSRGASGRGARCRGVRVCSQAASSTRFLPPLASPLLGSWCCFPCHSSGGINVK